jgi:uncharacterized protein YegP (UPF0339 family)
MWRLKAATGHTLAASANTYSSKQDCLQQVLLLMGTNSITIIDENGCPVA